MIRKTQLLCLFPYLLHKIKSDENISIYTKEKNSGHSCKIKFLDYSPLIWCLAGQRKGRKMCWIEMFIYWGKKKAVDITISPQGPFNNGSGGFSYITWSSLVGGVCPVVMEIYNFFFLIHKLFGKNELYLADSICCWRHYWKLHKSYEMDLEVRLFREFCWIVI